MCRSSTTDLKLASHKHSDTEAAGLGETASLPAKLFVCRGVRLRPKTIWYNVRCGEIRIFNKHLNQPLQNSHTEELSPK